MLCFLLLILAIPPVQVNAANYTAADFVSNTVVSGDTKTVYYTFGSPISPFTIFQDQTGVTVGSGYGTVSHYFESGVSNYKVDFTTYHFGSKFYTGSSSRDGLVDISDIVSGASITLDLGFRLEYAASVNPQGFSIRYRHIVCCYDAAYNLIDQYIPSWPDYVDTKETLFSVDDSADYVVPSGAAYIACMTQFQLLSVANTGTLSFSVRPDAIRMSVDINMIHEQSQTMQKIEQQLGDIGDKLDDTNNKLDEIISGGEAGEQLGAAGDDMTGSSGAVSDQAGQVGSDLDQVGDFESDLMDDLDSAFGDLDISTGVITFVPAMDFISGYLQRIYEGLFPWDVALTMPLFIGLFFGICQHVGGVTNLRARHAREVRNDELHQARLDKIRGGGG